MTIHVAYFFNSDLSLGSLAQMINDVLGTRLKPYKGDESDLFCRCMSLETSLLENSLENDGDLDFEAYRYELNTRTPGGDADLRQLQVALMATFPAVLQRRAGIVEGILVYDYQRLLSRYTTLRDGQLFDALANRDVNFPGHIQDVFVRAA